MTVGTNRYWDRGTCLLKSRQPFVRTLLFITLRLFQSVWENHKRRCARVALAGRPPYHFYGPIQGITPLYVVIRTHIGVYATLRFFSVYLGLSTASAGRDLPFPSHSCRFLSLAPQNIFFASVLPSLFANLSVFLQRVGLFPLVWMAGALVPLQTDQMCFSVVGCHRKCSRNLRYLVLSVHPPPY